ncbi:hypothetical protein GBA52_027411 [Prunus armeniaca]|nr:hypothetical protein GBA52_027411 [Prunus armeniaca]
MSNGCTIVHWLTSLCQYPGPITRGKPKLDQVASRNHYGTNIIRGIPIQSNISSSNHTPPRALPSEICLATSSAMYANIISTMKR